MRYQWCSKCRRLLSSDDYPSYKNNPTRKRAHCIECINHISRAPTIVELSARYINDYNRLSETILDQHDKITSLNMISDDNDKKIKNLMKTIAELKSENEELNLQLYYSPNGEGYMNAKKDFDDLVNQSSSH